MDEFFTLETLLSYPIAVVAVTLVTSTVAFMSDGTAHRTLLRVVALVTSMFLAYLGTFLSGADWPAYVLAFFNALVIFAAAAGIDAAGASFSDWKASQPKQTYAGYPDEREILAGASAPVPERKVFTRWL